MVFNNLLLVTFEGVDGCGKSTLINNIKKELCKNNKVENIITFREPGGSHIGEKIRNILMQGTPKCNGELFLFLASRSYMFEEMAFLEKENKKSVIFIDRYLASLFSYQYKLKNISNPKDMFFMNNIASNQCNPDIQFLVDTKLNTINTRTVNRIKDILDKEVEVEKQKIIEYYFNLYNDNLDESKYIKGDKIILDGNLDMISLTKNATNYIKNNIKFKTFFDI